MAPPAKPLSNPDPSTGVQRVDEPAAESIGARLARQNKAVERAMKHPANAEGPVGVNWAIPRGRDTKFRPETYDGMDTDATALSLVDRLRGRSSVKLSHVDLYRAYKHTPHQPASVFLKYLVHRINNVDAYDDPVRAIGLDIEFLKHHQKGKAAEKNAHVTGEDLHAWMQKHPSMPEALLTHKAALHAELARGVGLNVRSINGEPHVALTRGLKTDIMDHEHALSSWSDLVETGFGTVMHHAWVPLKDLWYSYQHGPEKAGGDVGHENEYLVAHTAPRYEAQPEDVKQVRGHHHPRYYDNATDDELASSIASAGEDDYPWGSVGSALRILTHKNAGPKTYAEVLKRFGDQMSEGDVAGTKHYTREQALASTSPYSIENPNLAKDDLHSKVLQFSQAGVLGEGTVGKALNHPSATADTARLLASQVTPDGSRDGIWDDLAKSPLTPPDVLDRILDRYEQLPPGSMPAAVTYVLSNPNSTSAHADRIVKLNRAKGHYRADASDFLSGKFSADTINELSDRIAKGYGKEPLHTEYIHGVADKGYLAAKAKFDRAKNIFGADYSALIKMGMNRHLDDDAIEALVDAYERHGMGEGLRGLALRQNAAPMSELSQLRVLRALDAASSTAAGGKTNHPDRERFAASKGLAPSAVWALALHPSEGTREALYGNKTVDLEVLAQAWNRSESPEEYLAHARAVGPGTDDQWSRDPYHALARAIRDRRAYAKRRAETHLIKPWPVGLAKSETDWWPVKLREWMSGRAKEEANRGYYYRASNLDTARSLVKDRVLPVEPTEDVLDGYVVFAHPARDYHYHSWEKDSGAGPALVYFETDDPPLAFDDRVYWPHDVHCTEARIAGIRPSNLQKAERPLMKMALYHDDHKRPKTVYRVEDTTGRGPYRNKYDLCSDAYCKRNADRQPPPGKDFAGTGEYLHQPANALYGFAKPEDAMEWFGPQKMAHLRRAGYELREVPAEKAWLSNSGRQLIFVPASTYKRGSGNVVVPQRAAPQWTPTRTPEQAVRDGLAGQYDAWKQEYEKHLDKLTAAYNALPPDQQKQVAEWDNMRYPDPVFNTATRTMEEQEPNWEPFTQWARTVVPGIFASPMKKSEPLSRGPAFNGEKDYRPDESGDPKFPFLGGSKKERSHEQLPELPKGNLEPGEHATALAQLGHSESRERTLAAACFLARRRFDADKFQQAMAVFNDERRAALHAVDLSDSEKNLQALEAVMKLQGKHPRALAKAEHEPIGIHSIQPGNEDAVDAAEAIERAVRGGFVQQLKLNGKHSKGAMAARDPRTGRVWLLKPGAGKASPAAGVRDGSCSQSRREAAFWHVADQVHLGGAVPRADLIIVNAQEWAAIKLLGADWKSLDERNREKQYKGREVLGPYVASGQVHRWSILLWVLGETDAHGQNLLANNGGSVALIDHGSAFAGPKFDPAHDTKSFIPFVLRVWAPDTDFKKLTPEERVKHMPSLGHYEDEVLKRWLVEDFKPEMVERVCRKYGIDDQVLQACLARLQELRSAPGNLSRTVNALWAGARRPAPDETR